MNRDFEDLGGADPYELLGVSPDADAADIKQAYRRLARNVHPDIGGDVEALRRLNLARDVLLDHARRMELDQRLRQRQGKDDQVIGEMSASDPGPRTAPYEDQFGWTRGTGPSPPGASREQDADPRPPYEDQFSWTQGTGPSPSPPYQWQPHTEPAYRQSAYGYVAQPRYPYRRRWSRLAIVSLVISLVFWPTGLPLGVLTLVRVRRRNERGAVLAWIAICWGLLLLCLTAHSAGWI